MPSTQRSFVKRFLTALFITAFFTGTAVVFIFKHRQNLTNTQLVSVTKEQEAFAKKAFYKQAGYNPDKPQLNYIENYLPAENSLNLAAKAYVLADIKTGTVILEHNPDTIIPPASLTKLVSIYTLMTEQTDLEKIMAPPKESYAKFLPPLASRMGLGENQQLSIKELILGMAVCSGNDAAAAAAIIGGGSVKNFAAKMNEKIRALGLTRSYFEEPSGLSANNKTTAKEFALFSLCYLKKYPENLKTFHSVKSISYPQKHNITVDGKKSKTRMHTVTKYATNTLLEKLEGCTGLKTGFIYESGFNIALTAKRGENEFLAVILGGEGKGFSEGISIREDNGKKIMEYAFEHFVSAGIRGKTETALSGIKTVVLGSALQVHQTAIKPIPVSVYFSADYLTVNKKDVPDIETAVKVPAFIRAPVFAGEQIGSIEYRIKNSKIVLKTIPLVSPADIPAGNFLRQTLDGALFINRF